MKSTIPKVMSLLHDRPLVDHVVGNAEASRVVARPVVVVSAKHTLVQEHLGDRADYVIQSAPLGTGHAVMSAESALRGAVDHVVVLYGDMPFLRPESIERLVSEHVREQATFTLLTATTPDFEDWRSAFKTFGRIVRDTAGSLERIVEWKDATDDEKGIRELSTCYFCFEADWLWSRLRELKNNNTQQEYYLTDLVSLAIRERARIHLLPVALGEVIGVNTPEDLATAHRI